MHPKTFEQKRLELFQRHGLHCRSRRTLDRSGRETYLIERADDGTPAVLIHGGLSEASVWTLLAGKLSGHLLIPDRPGFGLSYSIDYRSVDFRRGAVEWLLDLLDGLHVDRTDLIGNSMGGFFAMAFAIAHPDRVRRLVLVGAPAGLDKALPLFPRLWGNPVIGPIITRLKITDPEVLRSRVWASILVAHPERVPTEMLELAVAAAALPGVGRASYTMLRRVTTLRGWRRALLLRAEMAKLAVPTLFVWGGADAFAPPASGEELAARMPKARLQILADAGHLAQVDRPDAVAAAVREFLGN